MTDRQMDRRMPKENNMSPNPEVGRHKKYMYQIFFDEESIYEISKLYLRFVTDGCTDGSMDGPMEGQAQSNMPLQLKKLKGHNKA